MPCLSEELGGVVEAHAAEVNALEGSNAEETEVIQAALCRVLDHVLEWTPVDFETSERRIGGLETGFVCIGAEWFNRVGLDRDALFAEFAAWYRALRQRHAGPTLVSEVMRALVRDRASALDARAAQHAGTRYAHALRSLVQAVCRWDTSALLCEDVRGLEEPVALVAFSFGTGAKLGRALEMPTLVGPGLETPGNTNCGLAAAVRKILQQRPMPVYAQWEIADALLHGAPGAPSAGSFARWEFGDGEGLYRLREPLAVQGASEVEVEVCKAIPTWPRAVTSGEVALEDLREPKKMWRYYLGTPDVVQQMAPLWTGAASGAPRSFLLVGHQDHVGRCVRLLADGGGGQQAAILVAGPALMPRPDEWAACGCDAFGFDPASAQPWTRNRAMFLARELLARCGGVLQEVYDAVPHDAGHTLRFVG